MELVSRSHFETRIVGGGVQLGPLGTAATNRPVLPAPGDYDDREIGGMMIAKRNRSTRRKHTPVPLCPSQNPHACPDANPGRLGGKTATNSLSYGTALHTIYSAFHGKWDRWTYRNMQHKYIEMLPQGFRIVLGLSVKNRCVLICIQ
jgi:hypothetical protein